MTNNNNYVCQVDVNTNYTSCVHQYTSDPVVSAYHASTHTPDYAIVGLALVAAFLIVRLGGAETDLRREGEQLHREAQSENQQALRNSGNDIFFRDIQD